MMPAARAYAERCMANAARPGASTAPVHPRSASVAQACEIPDGLHEKCGVFAIHSPGSPVAHLTADGLHALQHRGEESAGMAVADGADLTVIKDMGLVTQVFNEYTLAALCGDLAIGHTRYSTTGSSVWENAQPVLRVLDDGRKFALGHNGNLTNTPDLAERAGLLPGTATSDTDVLAELLAQSMIRGADLVAALIEVLPQAEGAFSLVLIDGERVIGVRDPHGFRPLCLGRLEGMQSGPGSHSHIAGATAFDAPVHRHGDDVVTVPQLGDGSGWVLASESPALDIVGATFIREVEAGEVVVIDGPGLGDVRSLKPFAADPREKRLCVFEFVYFARADAVLDGHEVHATRQRMGRALAEQAPLPPARPGNESCPAMVMGVPDTGMPAAEGFARASGIAYGQGLVRNKYGGRTFIAPNQKARDRGVRRKLNPLRENITGKRLVVVDDSIVRGTTSRQQVALLRDAGAAEVHLRITSPPYAWPCFYGMDTGDPAHLIAASKSVEEIRQFVGADSLAYLEIDRLIGAVRGTDTAPRGDRAGYCTACVTGEYPTDVPVGLGKDILERV